ncbi:1-acyl-sn-glycerol-3-phosphate acyltransferase, partial [Nocardia salmonicida]
IAIGMNYGDRDATAETTAADVVSGVAYFRAPILEVPQRPADIARLVKEELQLAVDGAVAHY